MKKVFFLAAAALLSFSACNAQSNKVKEAEQCAVLRHFDTAKAAIDEAMQNEKTAEDPKTFLLAAEIYMHLAESGSVDNAVDLAKQYYLKAVELDSIGGPKGKKAGKAAKKIAEARETLAKAAFNVGCIQSENKNYKKSLEGFLAQEYYTDLMNLSVIDTSLYTNIGIISMSGEIWETGAKYFLKAARLMKTNPNVDVAEAVMTYRRAKYCYENIKDSVNIESTLKEAFEAYPQSQDIIIELIQYYLNAHKNDEALGYLNGAIAKTPDEPQFYFARGCLKEKTDFEGAEADYKKAIAIKPDYFVANYNLAILYYNKSLEIKTAASAERDMAKYNAMMEQSKSVMKKSIEPFVAAAACAPDNNQKVEVLSNLQKTYYNVEMYSESSAVKQEIEKLQQ